MGAETVPAGPEPKVLAEHARDARPQVPQVPIELLVLEAEILGPAVEVPRRIELPEAVHAEHRQGRSGVGALLAELPRLPANRAHAADVQIELDQVKARRGTDVIGRPLEKTVLVDELGDVEVN